MPTPARKSQFQHMHEISISVGFNTPGVTGGVQVGTLPAGAVVNKVAVLVTQAFNAGTTNTISVGSTPTGTQYINAIAGGAVARTDTLAPIAVSGPLAQDTPIYVSYGTAGTAATAGVATIFVDYIPGIG